MYYMVVLLAVEKVLRYWPTLYVSAITLIIVVFFSGALLMN